jgi:hypothetical protein
MGIKDFFRNIVIIFLLFIFAIGIVFTIILYKKEINDKIEEIKFKIILISSDFNYFSIKKQNFILEVSNEINEDNKHLLISIDTPENKVFSKESMEIFKAQVKLAKTFWRSYLK